MRRLLAALMLLAAAADATSIESLNSAAGIDFAQSPAVMRAALQESRPKMAAYLAGEGEELGRVDLARQLDQNLNLLNMTLGSASRVIGIATDASRKKYFLTFYDGVTTRFSDLGDSFKRVLKEGIEVDPDPATAYNLRVKANVFDPVRGSTFFLTPMAGTSGPSYTEKTSVIYDAIRAHATAIAIDGSEYLFAYGRDALDDGSGFAETRTFLIIHEAGLSTKALPVAEESLPLDTPSIVSLNGVRIELTRTSDSLIVRSAD